jgi:tRNA nucleotidyltransferase (CCA-adding enzyme)
MGKRISLEDKFPREVFKLIRRIGLLAESRGITVYLVGGVVRDILAGNPNLDLDLVVEGDGIDFAKTLSRKIGKIIRKNDLKTHKRFGTATLILKDGIKLDIVTARKEVYTEPAMLPDVTPGTIKDDLYRRDFTINCLALQISSGDIEIVDYFGGLSDLKRKLIRVNHSKSFIDDPTRIFRAVRFETRYGFQLEPSTLKWLKNAVNNKSIEKLTPKRRRTELFLILKEPEPSRPLRRLHELGVLRHLHRKLSFLKASVVDLNRAQAEFDNWKDSLKPNVAFLQYLFLIKNLDYEDAFSLSKSLAFTKKEMRDLLDLRIMQGRIKRVETLKPSGVYKLLHGLSSELLIFMLLSVKSKKVKKKIDDFLRVSRKVQLRISGHDLRVLGIPEGPLYREILEEVLSKRLDGKLDTKKEELNLAQRIWEQVKSISK